MIRDISQDIDLVIDVKLKNGTEYLACDIPSKVMGQHGNVIAFWPHRETKPEHLYMVPLEDVESVVFRDLHEPF